MTSMQCPQPAAMTVRSSVAGRWVSITTQLQPIRPQLPPRLNGPLLQEPCKKTVPNTRLQSADTRSLRWDSSTRVNSVSDFQNARVLMSSLLPSLPTAPVIRHFTELHSDPCCDKAEQVKREIETLIDLNLPEHLFMQLSGLGYMC